MNEINGVKVTFQRGEKGRCVTAEKIFFTQRKLDYTPVIPTYAEQAGESETR